MGRDDVPPNDTIKNIINYWIPPLQWRTSLNLWREYGIQMWAIGNNMKDAREFGNKNSEHLTFEACRINLSNKCKGDTWELWEQHKEHMTKPYGIKSKETNMEKWEGGLLGYLNCI
jgi:hypothetical protein